LLGFRAERLFARQVGGPVLFAALEIFLTTSEKLVARLTESLPDRLLVTARHRADGLPFGLKRLNRGGRLDPITGIAERFGTLEERLLLRVVVRAFLVLRGEMRCRSRVDFVLRGLEAAPHRLALHARRQRHLLPASLQLAHPPARDIEVLFGLERLHLAADL